MAGTARGSFARVTRCRQLHRPITAPRRRGGSPRRPITTGLSAWPTGLHPRAGRGKFRGRNTWLILGDGGRQSSRGRSGEGVGGVARERGRGSRWAPTRCSVRSRGAGSGCGCARWAGRWQWYPRRGGGRLESRWEENGVKFFSDGTRLGHVSCPLKSVVFGRWDVEDSCSTGW